MEIGQENATGELHAEKRVATCPAKERHAESNDHAPLLLNTGGGEKDGIDLERTFQYRHHGPYSAPYSLLP